MLGHFFHNDIGQILISVLKSNAGDQILFLDTCRNAIGKGAALQPLFDIPSKEKIGRAKFVDADSYVAEYAAIAEEMQQEIAAIEEKAGAEV